MIQSLAFTNLEFSFGFKFAIILYVKEYCVVSNFPFILSIIEAFSKSMISAGTLRLNV